MMTPPGDLRKWLGVREVQVHQGVHALAVSDVALQS